MKMKLLALTLCSSLVSGAFAAQVQISGAVDTYIAVNNMDGEKQTALSSGGVNASHVMFSGSEKITDSAEVFFRLDTAIFSETGAYPGSGGGRHFNREANLGIRGSWGELSFGRLYTPHFLTFLFFDPTGLSLGSSFSPFFMAGPHSTCGDQGELVRTDNAISYVLPTSFGLTNFFYMALGEVKESDGDMPFKRGNIYNYAAKYDYKNFSTMVSYTHESMAPDAADSGKDYHVQWINAAASCDLGFTKPVIQFEKKWGAPDKGSSDFWMLQLGTSTPVAGGLWMVSASYLRNQSRDDANAWGIGTKYNYPLSKRTRVYGGIQALFNQDNAGYAIEAGPDSSVHFHNSDANTIVGTGYGTDYLGKNVQQIFVGISHEF